MLSGRKARKRFPFAVRPKGSHVEGSGAFLPSLDEPESLPERCRGLLGEPPAHLVDLMHSRFESLIAGAAPEAIMEWAAVDIGLRARLVRAVGRSMLARRFGRCVFVSSSAPSARLKDRVLCGRQAGWRGSVPEPCRGAVRKGSHRLFLAPELAGCRAGRGIFGAQEGGRRKRMPIGRLVRMDAEAVETVLFLLSASASSVNGTVVTLDGGLSGDENHILRIEWITRK